MLLLVFSALTTLKDLFLNHQVHLSAVTTTIPAVSSSASAGLELSLATLSVGSKLDAERGNLPTGVTAEYVVFEGNFHIGLTFSLKGLE